MTVAKPCPRYACNAKGPRSHERGPRVSVSISALRLISLTRGPGKPGGEALFATDRRFEANLGEIMQLCNTEQPA